MATSSPLRRVLFPTLDPNENSFLGEIFRKETVGGLVAMVAAIVAVAWANSPWGDAYQGLRELQLGPLNVQHWASDFALTLFFFVAGLELKREFVVGSLSKAADAAVPAVAAAAGVAVPALIFFAINSGIGGGHPEGWAIPAATDIAFALAVLAVVGSNLPSSLRAFLLTLAVVDDLIVIIIIAIFFITSLQVGALLMSFALMAAWWLAMRRRVTWLWLYAGLGLATWWFMHESGIHATIAGVALGLLTRVRRDEGEEHSPCEKLEHTLSPISASIAVPFFALMSAGVVISSSITSDVTSPLVLGVVAGLVLGKPIGVFGGAWVVTRFTRAELSSDLSWRDLFGVAVLAGIGFTVSLLVSELSLSGAQEELAKTAVLAGSLIAGILGALMLGHRDRFRVTP